MSTIKMRSKEANGVVTVKALIKHPMETGARKNKKTGEIYETEEALKAANIPDEDVQRDVTVIMPPLDLIGKTK